VWWLRKIRRMSPVTEVAEVVRTKHSGELLSSSRDVLDVAARHGGEVRRVGHDGLTPHEVVERHWQTFVAHRQVGVYEAAELPMLGSGVNWVRLASCVRL
jgi:hypothetical protein